MLKSAAGFPWLTLSQAFWAARVMTAVFFLAHAITRIWLHTIPQFGVFMENAGFPAGVAIVWAITIVEIISGALLIAGVQVRWAALALFSIVAGGIVLIHAKLGWFVGEHGVGGSEYSVALIVLLLLIAVEDRTRAAGRVGR